MAKNIPFDEDTMTLIMGLGGPDKPGQHGRTMIPAPEKSAIDLITQIRDMCEDFLMSADKGEDEEKRGKHEREDSEEPKETEEDEGE